MKEKQASQKPAQTNNYFSFVNCMLIFFICAAGFIALNISYKMNRANEKTNDPKSTVIELEQKEGQSAKMQNPQQSSILE